jgi:beta-glucosidase
VFVCLYPCSSDGDQDDLASSPPYYPSPWATGQGEWAEAYNRAVQIVSQMTLDEKVNLTSGTGYVLSPFETCLR